MSYTCFRWSQSGPPVPPHFINGRKHQRIFNRIAFRMERRREIRQLCSVTANVQGWSMKIFYDDRPTNIFFFFLCTLNKQVSPPTSNPSRKEMFRDVITDVEKKFWQFPQSDRMGANKKPWLDYIVKLSFTGITREKQKRTFVKMPFRKFSHHLKYPISDWWIS